VREVHRRADGHCRIPYCDNTIVDKAHVFRRHADGGSREKDNIDLHCKAHHRQQERGEFENVGTTEDPHFVDADGVTMHVRRLALYGPDPPPG
jgi:hypothetical protein